MRTLFRMLLTARLRLRHVTPRAVAANQNLSLSRKRLAIMLQSELVSKTPQRFKNLHNKPLTIFLRELLHDPRNIGAACPSSKRLAQRIAAFVPICDDGYIVELGGGTGVVTAALLERGVDPERLIVIERSAKLVKLLQQRFPNLNVIHGDAAFLTQLLDERLKEYGRPVHTVVSCLPMRSLPARTARAISREVEATIGETGSFVHFTYDLRRHGGGYYRKLQCGKSKIVWRNLPPARVEVLHKASR